VIDLIKLARYVITLAELRARLAKQKIMVGKSSRMAGNWVKSRSVGYRPRVRSHSDLWTCRNSAPHRHAENSGTRSKVTFSHVFIIGRHAASEQE
jgi:hypothetical protein